MPYNDNLSRKSSKTWRRQVWGFIVAGFIWVAWFILISVYVYVGGGHA